MMISSPAWCPHETDPHNKGCAFNHDPVKPNTTQNQTDRCAVPSQFSVLEDLLMRLFSVKKRLNVDSPSFTPASLAVNDAQLPTKTAGLSPKTASAAPFKPKGLTSGNVVCEMLAQPSC